jgi:S-DNA-T family DNA segregation ATPase FtsK/SpoIIIE
VRDCECGFRYDEVGAGSIPERLLHAVRKLREEVAGESDAVVRCRPAPAVWSPLEYCCHLRDVLITQRERVVRVLVEERPTMLPMHREERAMLTRYAEEEPSRVLAQLGMAAEMASWTFASLDASQWMRECRYNYPEPMTRSLEWVGRHSLHEAVHHLADVRRILRPPAD